ncbi:MAG TPA: ATP-binding protein, partial [Candidatus Dormibacteraeota bacterium]
AGGVRHIARLLDSAAFSVAAFERTEDGICVAYVNHAASAQAAIGGHHAIGLPVSEVFPHVSTSIIEQLLATPGDETMPMNLRGMLPGGAAWSIDAIRLGPDRIVVLAEELGEAVSSRQRLEALLESMNAIWRPIDFSSMPSQIVEQAGKLLTDVDVALCVMASDEPAMLKLAASNADRFLHSTSPIDEDSLAARTARSGEPIEMTLPSDVIVLTPELQPDGIHAVRAVPFTVPGHIADGRTSLGVLVLVKHSAAPFTEAERRLIGEFGRLVALAMHRAELLRDARDSARRLQLTLDLAMAFASSLSAREVVQLLLSNTLDAVEADRATLSSLEADELVIEATYARSGELKWVGRRYPLDYLEKQPLVKRALETRRPVVGGRLDVDRAAPEFRDALSMMAHTANLPLMAKGQPAGLLVVSREGDRPYTADDISMIELMGNAAMLALRNARLFEDLELASAAKTQFLNMAAHELRTPVTVISGYTSILQSGGLDDRKDTDRALAVIEEKARELAKLVDALLVAARVQSGSIGAEREAFDIAEGAAQAVARAQPFAQLSGGTVTAVLPAGAVHALGNPEHASRILDNLINNAIAYSRGTPHVEVRIAAADAFVSVDVHDDGRGIPASHHAAIFDEFVRIDDGENGSVPGAGLGLYIGRRLAETMGGELGLVRSEPGEGSVFRLRLERPGAESSSS